MTKKAITFILCLHLFGCQVDTPSVVYPYEEEFLRYLNQTFGINQVSDQAFLVFSLAGCDPCFHSIMAKLRKTKGRNKIQLIMVGNVVDVVDKNDIIHDILRVKCVKFHDFDSEAHKFGIGLGKPIFIQFSGGKCVKFHTLKDSEVNDPLSNYLNGGNAGD
jgi:hypothetical protein